MKIGKKLTILAVAVLLSLAGFGALADALSADRIMAAARPSTQVSVHITG